jgi:hypothetical protein
MGDKPFASMEGVFSLAVLLERRILAPFTVETEVEELEVSV